MTDETPDVPGPDEGLPEHVRALLAAPAAPEGVLDRARNAAMDAFDEVHADDSSGAQADGAAVPPVRDLASAGSARRAWYQRVPLGAAAAVIAVVALVGVFSQVDLDSSDGDDMATADMGADDAGDAEAEEQSVDDGFSLAPEADEGAASSGDGESSPAAGSARAVYVYPDVDALVEDYQRRFAGDTADLDDSGVSPAATTSSDVAEFDASSCDAVAAAGIDPDRVVSVDPVRLGSDGGPATAFAVVYESEASGRRVAVVDEASCDPLAAGLRGVPDWQRELGTLIGLVLRVWISIPGDL